MALKMDNWGKELTPFVTGDGAHVATILAVRNHTWRWTTGGSATSLLDLQDVMQHPDILYTVDGSEIWRENIIYPIIYRV